MELVNSILHLPSFWLVIIGILALIVVLKVVRSIIGVILSLAFTIIGFIRLYAFLKGIL